jgi:hypothetical protein
MKRLFYSSLVALSATASPALAQLPILQPGDAVLAIDVDPLASRSRYPAAESPSKIFDGLTVNPGATKYLNFGDQGGPRNGINSGFIVTPPTPGTIVQSMALTTAGDADARDPATWAIYGTNDAIVSADNSDGSAENWTLISQGAISLPAARNTLGPTISFANATAYNSYRVVFPTLKNFRDDGLMQVNEVGLFTSNDATGASILTGAPVTSILAIQLPRSDSRAPTNEGADKLFDGLTNTKYLNFGKENTGFVVTPQSGASVIGSFQISTANDAPGRDPASWVLYGTNDPITSPDFSQGNLESWTLIDSGALALPEARMTAGAVVSVSNANSYTSYRMAFPAYLASVRGNSDGPLVATFSTTFPVNFGSPQR